MIWPCDWLRDHVSHTPTQMWNHAPPKKKKRNMKFDYIFDFFSHHRQTDRQTDTWRENSFLINTSVHLISLLFPEFVSCANMDGTKEEKESCVLNAEKSIKS